MAKKKSDARKPLDDDALFRAAMSDATPLEHHRHIPTKDLQTPTAPPGASASSTLAPTAATQPPRHQKSLEAGTTADLDRRTMDKLRKGRMRPEARLDLHGMTANQAHTALNSFLADAHRAARRCVLVITGKGSMKKGGGVIRRELPEWLNTIENRARILGFAQAQPGDGGGGAFYVLLKRRR